MHAVDDKADSRPRATPLDCGHRSFLRENILIIRSRSPLAPLAPVATALLLLATIPACLDGDEPAATATARSGVAPVDLGTAGDYVILAKTGVSTVPTSAITGDIGVSPIAATAITGFSLSADATNTFATSVQVTGKIYAATYVSPTPSRLTGAIGDMELAFTDAASRAADATELGAGDIGGMTLIPGVYKWSSPLLIPTNVTLQGSSTDVWIFEVAQGLTLANGTQIQLAGGARPENIFWQVSGGVSLGTTAHLEGIVLSKTAITVGAASSINGRLLAQTAVTLIADTVVEPSR